jgi:hypothetical protein
MFDKILENLKKVRDTHKFNTVSDRSLEAFARTLEKVITTDELLEQADFKEAVENIDKNIRHESSNAIKVHEEAQKKKKDTDPPKPPKQQNQQQQQQQQQQEEVPAYIQKLLDNQENMNKRIDGIVNEKTTSSRRDQLKKALEGTPKYYSDTVVSSFEKASFEDDNDFSTYLDGIKTNKDSFLQKAKEDGLNITTPSSNVETPEETGETKTLADARKVVSDAKKEK